MQASSKNFDEEVGKNVYSSYQNATERDNLLSSSVDNNSDREQNTQNSRVPKELKLNEAITAIGAFRLRQKQNDFQLVDVYEVSASGSSSGKKVTKNLNDLLEIISLEVSRVSGTAFGSSTPVPSGSSRGLVSESINRTRDVHFNDLRQLSHNVRDEQPSVIVRRHAVLVHFYPLRVVMLADKLFLIVPADSDLDADGLVQEIANDLHERYLEGAKSNKSQPVMASEFNILGSLLSTMNAIHEQEYLHLRTQIKEALSMYNVVYAPISVEAQEYFRHFKNIISETLTKIISYRNMFNTLLQDKETLALINLSVLAHNGSLYAKPLSNDILQYAAETEVLFENYLLDYNTLQIKLESMKSQIQFTEEMLFFRLDTQRNELLEGEIAIAIIMSVLGVVTFFTSAFGMNIYSGLEELNIAVFWSFLAFLIIFTIVGSYYTMIYFKRFGLFRRVHSLGNNTDKIQKKVL